MSIERGVGWEAALFGSEERRARGNVDLREGYGGFGSEGVVKQVAHGG